MPAQPLWRFFLARLAANLLRYPPALLPFLPLATLGFVVFLLSQRRPVDAGLVGLVLLVVCVRQLRD